MFSSFKTEKKEVSISYKCVEAIVSTANYKEDKKNLNNKITTAWIVLTKQKRCVVTSLFARNIKQ